jgi:hypothetical protein
LDAYTKDQIKEAIIIEKQGAEWPGKVSIRERSFQNFSVAIKFASVITLS